MKKNTKIFLIIFAVLTVLVVTAVIIMMSLVSGYSLLHMNSTIGQTLAVSYHWFLLAAIIFVVFWIFLAVKNRKAIFGLFSKIKQKPPRPTPPTIEPNIVSAEPPESTKKIFCIKCGKQISDQDRFCQFCGCSVNETAHNSIER